MDKIVRGVSLKELKTQYDIKQLEKLEKLELLKAALNLKESLIIALLEIDKLESEMVSYSEYDSTWGGIEKIEYILKCNARPMSSKELMKVLMDIEPFLNQKWDNPYSACMKYITRGVKFGRIQKRPIKGSRGCLYFLE